MTAVKGIFFDLGWTLEKPKTGDWNRTRLFEAYFPEVKPENYDRKVWKNAEKESYRILHHNHLLHNLEEEEEVFTQYYMAFVNALPDCMITEDVARIISHDRTYDDEKHLALPDAKKLLEILRSQGYHTGIISDTFPSVENDLRKLGIVDLFDTYTYSYTFGVFKPDPIMYEDALKQMQILPGETVFVDDLSINLLGAEKYGIHGIQSLAKPGSVSDGIHPYIHRPMDLLLILEAMQSSDQ